MNYREKVENNIGRKLKSSEIVHHKDGDKYNDKMYNFKITNGQKGHLKIHKNIKIDYNKFISKYIQDEINLTTADINKHLDIFFTDCQKYLILRKLCKLDLSKTDREYFSRVIKKKIIALANPTLHRIAQSLTLEF